MSDVQHLQSVLCLRRDKLSPRQKEKYEKQLLKKLDALQNSTGKLQDFPFQEKMNAFNELVADIQTGKISWESCKGKKELYIIRKLHQAQLSSLLRSYNYREID